MSVLLMINKLALGYCIFKFPSRQFAMWYFDFFLTFMELSLYVFCDFYIFLIKSLPTEGKKRFP